MERHIWQVTDFQPTAGKTKQNKTKLTTGLLPTGMEVSLESDPPASAKLSKKILQMTATSGELLSQNPPAKTP